MRIGEVEGKRLGEEGERWDEGVRRSGVRV